MEISKVSQNYFGPKRTDLKVNRAQNRPSFTGGVSAREMDYIRRLCGNPGMAKFVLENKWLEKLQGELGGILVTAFGTGLVAPFPIAFNPFVKAKPGATEEEKEEVSRTKKYSAWRQPISAVIAAFFQAGAQPYIDRFLDSLTNNPKAAEKWWVFLDQSAINKESYLKTILKPQLKKEIKEGTFVLKGPNKSLAFEEELQRRIKNKHAEQINDVAKILEKEGAIRIGKRTIDNGTMADLFNANVDNYINEAEKLKIRDHGTGKFKGRDFYLQRAQDLFDNEAELRRILDPEKLPPLEKDPKSSDIERLQSYIKEEIKSAKNDQIKEILEEILNKDDPVVRRSRCTRTLDRIDCIRNLCEGNFSQDAYAKVMDDHNRVIAELVDELKATKLDPATSTPEKLKESMAKLIDACNLDKSKTELRKLFGEGDGIFKTTKKAVKEHVYKDVVNVYQALVKARFTGISQAFKVLVGVCITLPVSCYTLNWAYPRFMEIFFPNLAGIKKDEAQVNKEGGNA